jgi:hypothetical protein
MEYPWRVDPMLVSVDCEAYGGAPTTGQLTELGAVAERYTMPSGTPRRSPASLNGER